MIYSLGVHGLRHRSVVALSRQSLHSGAILKSHGLINLGSRDVPVPAAWSRAASTSTSSPAPSQKPSNPPSSDGSRKKVDLHPKPIKPASTHKGDEAVLSPPSSPLRAVAKAEAIKAHAYTAGKAIEKMGTVQMMKFDVQDAIRRGIMTAPPKDASSLGSFWHQMKEVFKFYWRGIKQINANRITSSEIRKRVRDGGAPLTRAETRFIQLFRQDAAKLVPFVLIALVLEEIIPLLVLYAPWMLPSTCIMPSQAERIRTKRRELQIAFSSLQPYLDEVRKMGDSAKFVSLGQVKGAQLQALCGILGLSTFGPPPIRRRRLTKTLKRLSDDDAFLRAEDMGSKLSEDELAEALHERGIIAQTLPRSEWENKLRWWLKNADAKGVDGDAVSRRVMLVATAGARRW